MVHTTVHSAATAGITQINNHMPHTSRTDFNQTWLTEMPEGLGDIELWDMMLYNIQDQIRHGAQIIAVNANLKKITGSQPVYYWWEVAGEIVLAAEFSVRPQAYTVNAVAKSPQWRRKPPYMTDLYQAVLADTGQSIRLFSDSQLSNGGMAVWRKLLAAGCKISVYDRHNPGGSFVTISDADQLEQYFQDDDTDYRRYQYVLSEAQSHLDTLSYFGTRRIRELSGQSLD